MLTTLASTVAEYSTHHYKVESSSPAKAVTTVRELVAKNIDKVVQMNDCDALMSFSQ
jgi:hypothetical protein